MTVDLMIGPVSVPGSANVGRPAGGVADAGTPGVFQETLQQVARQGDGGTETAQLTPMRQESAAVDAEPSETEASAEAILLQAFLAGVFQGEMTGQHTAQVPVPTGEESAPTGGGEEGCAPCGAATGAVTKAMSPLQVPTQEHETTDHTLPSADAVADPSAESQPAGPVALIETRPNLPKPAQASFPPSADGAGQDPFERGVLSPSVDFGGTESARQLEADEGPRVVATSESVMKAERVEAELETGPLRAERSEMVDGGSFADVPLHTPAGVSAESEWGDSSRDRESGGQSSGLHSTASPQESGTPNGVASSSPFTSALQSADPTPRLQPVRAVAPPVPSPWEAANPSVRLEVAPGDGAPLQLHVSLVNHTVYARVVTGQPEMQDYLARNHAHLEMQLQQHGLEIGSFVVDSGQHQSGRPQHEWSQPAPMAEVRAVGEVERAEPSLGRASLGHYRLNVVA